MRESELRDIIEDLAAGEYEVEDAIDEIGAAIRDFDPEDDDEEEEEGEIDNGRISEDDVKGLVGSPSDVWDMEGLQSRHGTLEEY